MVYKLIKKMILSGVYEKETLTKKLDVFLLKDRITSEQYEELTDLMNPSEE